MINKNNQICSSPFGYWRYLQFFTGLTYQVDRADSSGTDCSKSRPYHQQLRIGATVVIRSPAAPPATSKTGSTRGAARTSTHAIRARNDRVRNLSYPPLSATSPTECPANDRKAQSVNIIT